MPYNKISLLPKVPGGPLRVLIVGRISTVHQHHENIEASYRYVEKYLEQVYQGPIHIKYLGEQASGMRTDRATILEAILEIATGTWDLVISEELSRFFRNPRFQYAFVQDAVDHDTRVICIADNLDTADENWEVALGAAALRHGLVIPDTRRRVKRTAQHSFHKGAMVQKVRYGYRKLSDEEAAIGAHGPKGLRIVRVPECTPVIREMARRIVGGATYTRVAEWLNEERVVPGPYSGGVWSAKLVKGLLSDPILNGTRTFRDWVSQTVYSTGAHKRRKNPDGPETEHYPELAHLSPRQFEELHRAMGERAAAHRHAEGRAHPLYNRPRKRSLWPGQHPHCGVCGELMYRYDGDRLKCRLAYRRVAKGRCWNHVLVRCEVTRERVLERVLDHSDNQPGFRKALADAAWSELQGRQVRAVRRTRTADDEVRSLEKRAANLIKSIEEGGESKALRARLSELEEGLRAARQRRGEQVSSETSLQAWGSRDELEGRLLQALKELAGSSYEFGDLMRKVIPEFVIVPVQARDSGLVRPRAKLTLRLSALAGPSPGSGHRSGDVPLVVDLFEPPVHIRAVPACVQARRADPGLTLDQIAARTGYNRMTVKRALAYFQLMEAAGSDDPYSDLKQRPPSASRWRHRPAS